MVWHGVRVPGEFAIVGHDDRPGGAVAVPLTAVGRPRQELVVRESSMVRLHGTDTGRTA